MWHTEIESKIIEHGRRNEKVELGQIRKELLNKHSFITYAVSRFLTENGDMIDENDEVAVKIYKHLFEEYSTLERLLLIMKHYDR